MGNVADKPEETISEMLSRLRHEAAAASAAQAIRERCLQMAISSNGPGNVESLLSRAEVFLKFVKGG